MLKTREILRLRHELGLSLREIGQVCSCGKTTVDIRDRYLFIFSLLFKMENGSGFTTSHFYVLDFANS